MKWSTCPYCFHQKSHWAGCLQANQKDFEELQKIVAGKSEKGHTHDCPLAWVVLNSQSFWCVFVFIVFRKCSGSWLSVNAYFCHPWPPGYGTCRTCQDASHGVLKSFKYNGSFAILGSQNLQQQFYIGILQLDRSLWLFGSMRFPRLWQTDCALVSRARLWKNFRRWLISQLHLQHWILGPVMFHMTGSSKCFPMQLPIRFDFCWWFSHLLFVSHVARQRRMMTVLFLDFIGRKLWVIQGYCQYIWAKEARNCPERVSLSYRDIFIIYTWMNQTHGLSIKNWTYDWWPSAYAIQQLPPQSSCCHVTPRISATKPGNGKVETAVNYPLIEHVTLFSEGWFEELHAKLPPGSFWTFVVSFFLILLATFIAWSEMWTLPCRKRSGLHKLQCTGACWEAQDLGFMHPNVL